jgi:hypothetical protein
LMLFATGIAMSVLFIAVTHLWGNFCRTGTPEASHRQQEPR